jgi:hypothetical protein
MPPVTKNLLIINALFFLSKFVALKNDNEKKNITDISMFGAFINGYKKIF